MARKFISFEDVEKLATIDRLVEMLNLDAKPSGRQLRATCPVHGGDNRTLAISPDVRSKRGSIGVFFCQQAQEGGDRIGLVAHCMQIGQQDAAFFIAEQFGNGTVGIGTVDSTVSKERATLPQKAEGRANVPQFDPQVFAQKLDYSAQVSALGISKETAELFSIGAYRGKVYLPLRHPNGDIAGWLGFADGVFKEPPRWLPQTPTNVVSFYPKKTA